MKIAGYQCPKCGDIVYSRARHDMRYCSCGKMAVDGGFNYTRMVYDPDIDDLDIKRIEVDIDATSEILYSDWNKGIDKYGLILSAKYNINGKRVSDTK